MYIDKNNKDFFIEKNPEYSENPENTNDYDISDKYVRIYPFGDDKEYKCGYECETIKENINIIIIITIIILLFVFIGYMFIHFQYK